MSASSLVKLDGSPEKETSGKEEKCRNGRSADSGAVAMRAMA